MKHPLIAICIATTTVFSAPVFANCFGSPAMQTCTDDSGNSYTVNRLGNMTMVQGTNAQTGSSWNETATTYGNTTQINGQAANGANWNENITELGNGNRVISGTNASGQSFYKTCNAYGCN
ncbi:hypothetical protein [Paraburkholderia sp. BR14320]|uniref:hypothetical protein n=1 Tax=unclassified Paraburkholderia TaxID=2615204 RepID=UPI0034CD7963